MHAEDVMAEIRFKLLEVWSLKIRDIQQCDPNTMSSFRWDWTNLMAHLTRPTANCFTHETD